ncbi:MAG: SAP domain-containing protein [Nitrosomonadales bacterium]|nr:SAP domain-containing protein [Nitrosomonadales bacterium]
MKLQDIRAIAKQYQIRAGGLSKTELIHQIQQLEGNFDCFGSACDGVCDQSACLWREDCFATAAGVNRA